MPVYQKKFSISSGFSGFISGCYFIPSAIMQLFAAPLTRKFGAMKVIGFGMLIATAGSFCFAFANNEYVVLLGRLCLGIGVGPVFISIVTFLTEYFSGREFSLYTGLAVTFCGFGQAMASAPLKWLIETFNIGSVFLVISFILVLISAIIIVVSFSEETKVFESEKILNKTIEAAKAVFKSPVLFYTAIAWILSNGFQNAYQALWSASWFEAAFTSKAHLSGLSGSIISVGLMAGTFFSERLKKPEATITQANVCSQYLYTISVVLCVVSHLINPFFCLITDFAVGFGIGILCIQQNAYMREKSDDSISASILGFVSFCSSMLSVFFQWLTGLSYDLFNAKLQSPENSFLYTFSIFAIIIVVLFLKGSDVQMKSEKNDNLT